MLGLPLPDDSAAVPPPAAPAAPAEQHQHQHPPHIERAWQHYCAETAGSVAGGADHWDQVPLWVKVDCLRTTGGLPAEDTGEIEVTTTTPATPVAVVRVRHLPTGLTAYGRDHSQIRARNAALVRLADVLAATAR